jgi:hypothetical protein
MRVISFIEDPQVIDKIIRHLKLSFQAERPPPCHAAHKELLIASEESGKYFREALKLSYADLRAESISNIRVWRFGVNCVAF